MNDEMLMRDLAADKRLRDAAPDMLAALKAVLPFIERGIEGYAAIAQVGAAIEKAEAKAERKS